jgi:hypothetical protein
MNQPKTNAKVGLDWLARSPRLVPLVRLCWILLAIFTLVVVIAAIGPRFRSLSEISSPDLRPLGQLTAGEAAELARYGLSARFYAVLFTVLEVASALAFVALSAIIFYFRSDDGYALFAAIALLPFGAIASPLIINLAAVKPAWDLPVLLLHAFSLGLGVLLIYTFPDGHFAPRWVRWLALFWLVYVGAWFFYPSLRIIPSLMIGSQAHLRTLLLGMFALISATGIQLYRYAQVYTLSQRQQTKWVVLGLVAFVGSSLLVSIPLFANPDFTGGGAISIYYRMFAFSVVLIGELVFLITFVVAILRYRLWDIDFIIRRTLQYAILIGALAIVYTGSVILLQSLVVKLTGEQSPLVIVLSTLAIAALFNPLRIRVQDFIDRRFYRKKYDAEQALAKFASAARNEVDMDQLTTAFLGVVEETMQPSRLSLFINPRNLPPNQKKA